MLSRKNRISLRDFPKTQRAQKNYVSDSFSLAVFSKEGLLVPKASVVVSKKIAKTAVERNKIRRKIYNILQKSFLGLEKKVMLIFYVKPPALEKSTTILRLEIENLLSEI